MEGSYIFSGIVLIVWGILGIILFFKVWRMTNDVKVLRKRYAAREKSDFFMMLEGNTEIVARNIRSQLVEELIATIRSTQLDRDKKISLSRGLIEKAKNKLEIIGALNTLPDHLQSYEAFAAYYNSIKKIL